MPAIGQAWTTISGLVVLDEATQGFAQIVGDAIWHRQAVLRIKGLR